MTDYFHTNFYLTLGIGSYKQPYKVELPKLDCKEKDKPEVFKHPEGAAHKAIRQALGKARFDFIEHRRHSGEMILGEDHYGSHGEHYFWPKDYSSAKLAQKRMDKLEKAGSLQAIMAVISVFSAILPKRKRCWSRNGRKSSSLTGHGRQDNRQLSQQK